MARMTRGLHNDVQNDFPKGLESPITEMLSRPPTWLGLEGEGGNDPIGQGSMKRKGYVESPLNSSSY